MSRVIRFALFGCGRIGRVHADSIDVHPRAELAWVYDPIESAALEVAKQYGAALLPPAPMSRSMTRTLTRLSLPRLRQHTSTLFTLAVRAGKAVLCEKPIDLDLARVDRCWTEIAALNPTVMIGFNRRFDPSFREVHERVAGRRHRPPRTAHHREPRPSSAPAVTI